MRLLFLDFDGVLHPDAVFLTSYGIELRAKGELFMWSSHLVEALGQATDISIVLSTSWVRNLGYSVAKKNLPCEIQKLLIGATWHSAMGRSWPDQIIWDTQTRYEQIAAYLAGVSHTRTGLRWTTMIKAGRKIRKSALLGLIRIWALAIIIFCLDWHAGWNRSHKKT